MVGGGDRGHLTRVASGDDVMALEAITIRLMVVVIMMMLMGENKGMQM